MKQTMSEIIPTAMRIQTCLPTGRQTKDIVANFKQMKSLQLIFVFTLLSVAVIAQNVAITDDDAYSAESSAMLDVKSTNKGMLVPRLTTAQRTAISNPATGLLVFDTDSTAFYFYNGSLWTDLSSSQSEFWSSNESGVYMSKSNLNLGIGSVASDGKLEVQGDGDLLFAVKNSNGDTIFAVYDGGVRIYVDDSDSKNKGSKGGFAVGGISASKGITSEFLRITPDSIRMYVKDQPGTKTVKGGFAVGGISSSKVASDEYLRVTPDSVRIYVDDPLKGAKGGFAVGGISSSKDGSEYLQINKENYFIGLGAGASNTTGMYNSFLGYQAGNKNESGNRNIFLGYQAGFNNIGGSSTEGDYNIFLGNRSGYSNTSGHHNLFFGYQSGRNNTSGYYNLFMGYNAGYSNTIGKENTYIGYNVASDDTTGFNNVYIGYYAAANAIQGGTHSNTKNYWNVAIGSYAGQNMQGTGGSVFVGYDAGRYTTTGSGNTYIGIKAGVSNEDGRYNTSVGSNAANNNVSGSFNVMIGQSAGYKLNGSNNNTFLGSSTGFQMTSGFANTFLGYQAGYNKTGGTSNILIGYQAGSEDTGGTGDYNVAIGYQAGYDGSGDKNVFIGYKAGYAESGSNKLYIHNSESTSPLIYGDFSSAEIEINGALATTGDLSVGGTFLAGNGMDLTGTLDVSSDLTVGGSGTITGALDVNSNLSADGTGTFSGLLAANAGLSVTGTATVSSTFTANSSSYLNGTTYLNGDVVFNSTSFRIASSPGGGTNPSSYVFQGTAGSTSKSLAFAIYDALWVTDNAYFDAGITLAGTLTANGTTYLNGSTILGGTYLRLSTDPGSSTYPTNYFYQGVKGSAAKAEAFAIYDALWVTDNVYLPEVYDTKITATGRRKMYVGPVGLIGYNTSKAEDLKNVKDVENVNWLFKLRPVNFEYRAENNGAKEFGLVAEEVAEINSSLVSNDKEGNPETVNYEQLVTPLLKAIQDQQKLIEELQKRIVELEQKVK